MATSQGLAGSSREGVRARGPRVYARGDEPHRGAAVNVRILTVADAAALVALRRRALEDTPLAFASSLEDDGAFTEAFQREALSDLARQIALGAFEGDALVGMAVAVRPSKLKRRHVADIFAMYVAPEARGRGAGRALLRAAIAAARGWEGVSKVMLSVSSSQPAAHQLYRSEGFREWGFEADALRWEGQRVDEHHLALDLGEILPGEGVD